MRGEKVVEEGEEVLGVEVERKEERSGELWRKVEEENSKGKGERRKKEEKKNDRDGEWAWE